MSKKDSYKVVEYIFDPLLPYQKPNRSEVETQKELLSLSWIKPYQKDKRFARFTISEKDTYKYLMIEDIDCNWWIPVAILPLEFPTNLPKFKSIKDKTLIEDDAVTEVQEMPKYNTKRKKKAGV